MDEKLMQFLQEQFNKIDRRFDEVSGEIKSLREEIAIIKEQTARNSEMSSIIDEHGKRIYNLETDVSVIKRAMRN